MSRRRQGLVASLALNVALLVGLGVLVTRRLARRPPAPDRYAEHRASLFAELAAPRRDVVLLGDSLTDFGEWPELLGRADVVNRGIAGDTIAGVRARLPAVLALEPRAVVVMVGVNDLARGVSPAAAAAAYGELLAALRAGAPDAAVIVQALLPVNRAVADHGADNPAIAALNARLPALAAAHGADFVDPGAGLRDDRGALATPLTGDGIHLTGAGYRIWAAALAPRLPAPAPR